MCWVLALLMILGGATLTISMLLANDVAAESTEYNPVDYSFSSTDGDTYIAVGLMYDSGVTQGFEIKAPYGFVIGQTNIQRDVRYFEGLYTVNDTVASAMLDGNMSKKNMTYTLTDDPAKAVIGGYHIELSKGGGYLDDLVKEVDQLLSGTGLYAIPTINDGLNRVRVGSFTSREQAESKLNELAGRFEGFYTYITPPSRTCVSVVNPTTDKILFEYETGSTGLNIGFSAIRGNSAETEYIQTPAGNIYGGAMCFVPQYNDDAIGVKLINLIDLESYVSGVVPFEISNSWHMEVLRTYALASRSYAISNYNKRFTKYGFDLLPTASDQVYKGQGRVNDAVKAAVESTAGMVITHSGKICGSYYSSSVGGHTVSGQYVWGSVNEYLTGIPTPWERYSEYNKALWHTEVSGTDIYNTLRKKGYTELSGAVKSITYTPAPDGSGYVSSITFTDVNGKTLTINRADKVKSALSSYLNSANFIVGQNSLDFVYDNVLNIQVSQKNPIIEKEEAVVEGYISGESVSASDMTVISGSGEKIAFEGDEVYVLTADGPVAVTGGSIASANSFEGSSEFNESITVVEGNGVQKTDGGKPTTTLTEMYGAYHAVFTENANIKITTTLKRVTETLTASKEGNFIFAGKGWGHGVGLSQYGAKDLADAGAIAEDIISIYLNGAQITPYSEIK